MRPRITIATLLRENLNITDSEARQHLDVVFDAISDLIAEQGWVNITHFGHFTVAIVKARTIISPLTGEKRDYPATKMVRFKPAPAFRAKLVAKDTQRPLRYMRGAQRRKWLQEPQDSK